MNALKNRVQLIGNLGNDPEIVNLDGGSKLAKFSIATSESYKNAQGEKVEETQWHNIVAWGKTAEIVENYLAKGKQVAVDGKGFFYSCFLGEFRFRFLFRFLLLEFLGF